MSSCGNKGVNLGVSFFHLCDPDEDILQLWGWQIFVPKHVRDGAVQPEQQTVKITQLGWGRVLMTHSACHLHPHAIVLNDVVVCSWPAVALSAHSELEPPSSQWGECNPGCLYFISSPRSFPVNDDHIVRVQEVYCDIQSAQIFCALLFDRQGTN